MYVKSSWLCEEKARYLLEAEAMAITVRDQELMFVVIAVYRPFADHTKACLAQLQYTLQKHDNMIMYYSRTPFIRFSTNRENKT